MLLLGYMIAGSGYPETGMAVKMDGSANTNQISTLTIEEISLNSTAMYFCAASFHSVTYCHFSIQKPSLTNLLYLCITTPALNHSNHYPPSISLCGKTQLTDNIRTGRFLLCGKSIHPLFLESCGVFLVLD